MKETQNVRIDKKVINKVKKVTAKTKQSLGGFFEIAATEKIKADIPIKVKEGGNS